MAVSEFLDEFETTLGRVLEAPERWRRFRGDNRKLNFRRFPYAIVYNVKENNRSYCAN